MEKSIVYFIKTPITKLLVGVGEKRLCSSDIMSWFLRMVMSILKIIKKKELSHAVF